MTTMWDELRPKKRVSYGGRLGLIEKMSGNKGTESSIIDDFAKADFTNVKDKSEDLIEDIFAKADFSQEIPAKNKAVAETPISTSDESIQHMIARRIYGTYLGIPEVAVQLGSGMLSYPVYKMAGATTAMQAFGEITAEDQLRGGMFNDPKVQAAKAKYDAIADQLREENKKRGRNSKMAEALIHRNPKLQEAKKESTLAQEAYRAGSLYPPDVVRRMMDMSEAAVAEKLTYKPFITEAFLNKVGLERPVGLEHPESVTMTATEEIARPFEVFFETIASPARELGEKVSETNPVLGWFVQLGVELLTFKGLHIGTKSAVKNIKKIHAKFKNAQTPKEQAALAESLLAKIDEYKAKAETAADMVELEKKLGASTEQLREIVNARVAPSRKSSVLEGSVEEMRPAIPIEERLNKPILKDSPAELIKDETITKTEPLKITEKKDLPIERIEKEPGLIVSEEAGKKEITSVPIIGDESPVIYKSEVGKKFDILEVGGKKKSSLELQDGTLTEARLEGVIKEHYKDAISKENLPRIAEHTKALISAGAENISLLEPKILRDALSGKLNTKAVATLKIMRGTVEGKPRAIKNIADLKEATNKMLRGKSENIKNEAIQYLEKKMAEGLKDLKIPRVSEKNFIQKLIELNESKVEVSKVTEKIKKEPEIIYKRKSKGPTEQQQMPVKEAIELEQFTDPLEKAIAEKRNSNDILDKIFKDVYDSEIAGINPLDKLIYIPGLSEAMTFFAQRKIKNIKQLNPGDILVLERIKEQVAEGIPIDDFLTQIGANVKERRYIIGALEAMKKIQRTELTKLEYEKMNPKAEKIEADVAKAVAEDSFLADAEATVSYPEFLKSIHNELVTSKAFVKRWREGDVMPERQMPDFWIGDAALKGQVGNFWQSPNNVWKSATDVMSRPTIDFLLGDMASSKNTSNYLRWNKEILKDIPRADKRIKGFLKNIEERAKDRITIEGGKADKAGYYENSLQYVLDELHKNKIGEGKIHKYTANQLLSIKDKTNLASIKKRTQHFQQKAADILKKNWDTPEGQKIIIEEPSVRIALELGSELPDWAKSYLKGNEVAIVSELRGYLGKVKTRLEEVGIPTIKTRPYVTHLWEYLTEDKGSFGLLDTFSKKAKAPSMLAFHSQTSSTIPFPDIHTIMETYIPIAERKLAYQPAISRGNKMTFQMDPKTALYWDEYVSKNIDRTSFTGFDNVVNKWVNFEYFRLMAFATRVAFKHLFKLAGTPVEHGFLRTAQAVPSAFKVPIQAMAEMLGKKGPHVELDLYQHFVQVNEMVRVLDGMEGLKAKGMDTIKSITSSPILAVEAFDNGMNVFTALKHSYDFYKKGNEMFLTKEGNRMPISETTVKTTRAILDSIMQVNFRGRADQPLWAKSGGWRAITMFQMTPFKLFEYKYNLIKDLISGKKDVFGTHAGVKLGRYILVIGLAETIAREFFNTSILENFLHPPFVSHLMESKVGGFEVHAPSFPLSPIIQFLNETQAPYGNRKKAKKLYPFGFFEADSPVNGIPYAMLKHLTEFPQQRNWKRAFEGNIPEDYANTMSYLVGTKKLDRTKKKSKKGFKFFNETKKQKSFF